MEPTESNNSLSHFDYDLDSELIATEPRPERDQSRLLVYHRKRQTIEHRDFKSIPEYFKPEDLLVLNNTRVFPARLSGVKKKGGKIELLFLQPYQGADSDERGQSTCWEVLVKGKSAQPLEIVFQGGVTGTIFRHLEGGRKVVRLHLPEKDYPDVFTFLEKWGEVPLPPYILKRRLSQGTVLDADQIRYQTVYAEKWGSAAAPTAGLHFTEALMRQISDRGTNIAHTTLHIGLDTFLPIRAETIPEHKMHSEWFQVPEETAVKVEKTRLNKGRVIAVGTTVARALESAAQETGQVEAVEGYTDLFITPGYCFKGIDALVTNFHLPKSTLLVMITAFAGFEAVQKIYKTAIQERYRFYSYGDAMLIL